MENKPSKGSAWEKINVNIEILQKFFLSHLDRIYAAKLHLLSKMDLISDSAQFAGLKAAIEQTKIDVERQVARIQMIYTMLDAQNRDGSINGLTGLIEDAFEAIEQQEGEAALQDLSIIFYLQNIESIEMASFQILQMAAIKLENKSIAKLLQENYDEAKAGRALLLLVSSKYMID